MEPDLPGGIPLLATLGTAGAAFALWLSSLVLKRFGINLGSVGAANDQAQKDMLDWQREQLAVEVTRRERAETLVQDLLKQVNEMTSQMDRLEFQNEQMKAQIEALTKTVEQFKSQMTGGRT